MIILRSYLLNIIIIDKNKIISMNDEDIERILKDIDKIKYKGDEYKGREIDNMGIIYIPIISSINSNILNNKIFMD